MTRQQGLRLALFALVLLLLQGSYWLGRRQGGVPGPEAARGRNVTRAIPAASVSPEDLLTIPLAPEVLGEVLRHRKDAHAYVQTLGVVAVQVGRTINEGAWVIHLIDAEGYHTTIWTTMIDPAVGTTAVPVRVVSPY